MDKKKIINSYISLRPIYKKLSEKVSLIIEELLELNDINYHAVNYRAKTIESFKEKINKPKYENPLEQLTDLAGIRIIGYVEDDVKLISSIVQEIFEIDKDNSLDKSMELGIDKVGYKSVHFVCKLPENRTNLPEYSRFKGLKFEIQIRTILQHSWAEIEHDKNYKFSGELPSEIQRRFKLVAGNLELADREFNLLSREIDEYGKGIKLSAKKGKLDIDINSTALKEFLNLKLETLIKKGIVSSDFIDSDSENEILLEFRNFGVKTLSDLDKLITSDLLRAIEKNGEPDNFLGVSRLIMLASNIKKYMKDCYKGQWATIAKDHVDILKDLEIDLSEFKEYLEE